MKEKLLLLLVAKFAGVPEAMLEGIATKKAGSVSDEAQLQSIVDGIDIVQVLQSNVDKKITESNKLAVQNYEATHKIKDGKPVSAEAAKPDVPNPEVPEWAKSIIQANNDLKTKLEGFQQKETQTAMLSRVKASLGEKKIPESFWSKRGISVESDEQLAALVTEIESDYTAFRQDLVNSGVIIDVPASSFAGGEGDFAAKMKAINTTEVKS